MPTSRSFVYTSVAPPLRYRTPSPPRWAIEPISPFTSHTDWPHNGTTDPAVFRLSSEEWNRSYSGTRALNEGNHDNETARARESRAGTANHSRSGSNIDTLATIALATSPTFTSPSIHMGFGDSMPFGKHAGTHNSSIERPSKRARSEKAPSPVLQRTDERPATSHTTSYEAMREDVELLLNFARPTNFAALENNMMTETSNQGPPQHSAVQVQWSMPFSDSQDHIASVNKEFDSNQVVSLSLNVSDRVHVQDGKHNPRASPHDMSLPEPHQFQASDVNTATQALLHLEPSLTEDPSKEKQIISGEDSESTLDRSKGDIDAHEFDIANGSVEPEPHDMATATCAACDSAWIDENGADPASAAFWIRCDGCKRWFHLSCTEIKDEEEMKNIDKFSCKDCESTHGPTTYVRKSSRARTAIDYAGLNQGVVKASVDGPAHHYIQPFKDGTMKFLPESFPRMRAELVTAEYFEKGSGMFEPIVIPASMNGHPSTSDVDGTEATADAVGLEVDCYKEDFFMEDDYWSDWSGDDESEAEVDCGQDGLDMVIPKDLTVRMVTDLYGPEEKVEVIDVKSQQGEEAKRWNMRRWAEYYESESDSKVIRNVISLEVSQSKLGRLIRRPKIVRDLDLQDSVWPEELKAIGDYPKVQFYCLMSVADCYTDFHIDFGGSSVFYHILKGKKTFFFIPPKEKHLKKYEEWCNSRNQDTVFLGEETKECYRVDLSPGDTMLIPAGWIHAVWTPENSLVIGGNFLTRMHYGMQIKIAKVEKDTGVARKFRYPYFQKILWYAAIKYVESDPVPASVVESFREDENYRFYRKHPSHYEFGERTNTEKPGSELFNVRYYSQAELDGLPDLAKYLLRTALIAQELLIDGITAETRKAVKRSIPKGHGEALDIIKAFGIWLAWKRGNERAANWTHPDMYPSSTKADAKWTRQPEKNVGKSSILDGHTGSNRQSTRKQTMGANLTDADSGDQQMLDAASPLATRSAFPSTPKPSGLGPKRIACDACRKRRIRCRHKDETSETKKKPYAVRVEMNTKSGGSSGSKSTDVAGDESIATPAICREFTQVDNTLSVNGPIGFSKKGRSKACDECRKSKRRCIHDEFGRIDPIKAQEPSKPRAAGTTKRPRSSNEGLPDYEPATKNPKQEPADEQDGATAAFEADNDVEESAILLDRPPGISEVPAGIPTSYQETQAGDGLNDQPSSATTIINASFESAVQAAVSAASAALNVVDATEHANEIHEDYTLIHPPGHEGEQSQDNVHPQNGQHSTSKQSPAPHPFLAETLSISFPFPSGHKPDQNPHSATMGPFLASPPNSHEDDIEISPTISEHGVMDLQTPKSNSRQSSRQPKQVDHCAPGASSTKKFSKSSPTDADRRLSSSTTGSTAIAIDTSPIQSQNQFTPRTGTKQSSRRRSSVLSLTKSSPALTAKSTSPNLSSLARRQERKSSQSFGEIDADPESLKLIRALQEEEFGLRSRGRAS